MSSQIEDIISTCSICITHGRNNTKEPIMPHNVLDGLWAQVGADLFQLNGHHYLLLVDYYSSFIEVSILNSTTSKQVITHYRFHFSHHDIPDLLISHISLVMTSRNSLQIITWNIVPPSLYTHNQMGWSKNQLQAVKALIKKAIHDKSNPYIALLDYQNTPQFDSLGYLHKDSWEDAQELSSQLWISCLNSKLSASHLYIRNCRNIKTNRNISMTNIQNPFQSRKKAKKLLSSLKAGGTQLK